MLEESFLLWFAREYQDQILMGLLGAFVSTVMGVLLAVLRRKRSTR